MMKMKKMKCARTAFKMVEAGSGRLACTDPAEAQPRASRPGRLALHRIDKLQNFRPLLVNFRQVLFVQLPMELEFLLP